MADGATVEVERGEVEVATVMAVQRGEVEVVAVMAMERWEVEAATVMAVAEGAMAEGEELSTTVAGETVEVERGEVEVERGEVEVAAVMAVAMKGQAGDSKQARTALHLHRCQRSIPSRQMRQMRPRLKQARPTPTRQMLAHQIQPRQIQPHRMRIPQAAMMAGTEAGEEGGRRGRAGVEHLEARKVVGGSGDDQDLVAESVVEMEAKRREATAVVERGEVAVERGQVGVATVVAAVARVTGGTEGNPGAG